MNPEFDTLNEEQRRLLGERQADELLTDQRWLTRQLGPPDAPLPRAVRERLLYAVGRETERAQRMGSPIRRRLPYGWAVAAALLLGLLGVLMTYWLSDGTDRQPEIATPPTGPATAPVVVRAERAVEAYVASIRPDDLQSELDLLDEELPAVADLSENPWDAVIAAIEQPR